jgi:hypothetical protein
MRTQARAQVLRNAPIIALFRASLTSLVLLVMLTTASGGQEGNVRQTPLGMEIILPGDSTPRIKFRVDGRGLGSIPRQRLKINDPNAAGEFIGINIWGERDGDVIKVRLALIYFDREDIDNAGRKNIKEKMVGSYLVREGETVRAAELDRVGIEPFEMKVMDATPVVLKPGEGPRITNSSVLEVEKIEHHFDAYRIWLKNKSDKDIVAYTVSTGNRRLQPGGGGHSAVLASGATSKELYFQGDEVERTGINISVVIFADGSFEGDPKLATDYLANAEGVKIQSPSVLRMIEQTLKVDDSDLRAAFYKLEADLWVIPEAMYKQPALQFLKAKFPDQDEKALSALYEVFKGGLYDARNIALSSLGDTGRIIKDFEERSQFASAVELIRRTLERLKETFGEITSAKR